MSTIAAIHGRQILDSRGNPTVEVDAILTERPPQPTPEPEPVAPVVPQVVPGTLVERGEEGVVTPSASSVPP